MAVPGLGPEDLLLVLGRALAVGTLFVAFGTALIRRCVAGVPTPDADRSLQRLQWAALGAAVAATLLWCATETAAMAGTDSPAAMLAMLPAVLSGTAFGHLVLIRVGLLALAAAATVGGASALATVLIGLAVVVQAGHLHAFAMRPGPSLLLAAEALHVLAAGAWLGSLPALLILVAATPAERAGMAARRFSALGIAAVLTVAASAAWLAWQLVGTWAGLLDSAYGRVALAKLALFAVLVALAGRNRLWLVPRTMAGGTAAQRRLRRSIAAAAVIGVIVVALASLLSTLPPAIDLVSAPP